MQTRQHNKLLQIDYKWSRWGKVQMLTCFQLTYMPRLLKRHTWRHNSETPRALGPHIHFLTQWKTNLQLTTRRCNWKANSASAVCSGNLYARLSRFQKCENSEVRQVGFWLQDIHDMISAGVTQMFTHLNWYLEWRFCHLQHVLNICIKHSVIKCIRYI